MLKPALAAIAVLVAAGGPALAADAVVTRTVTFPPGAASTALKGTVKGYGTVNYIFSARAGQTMTAAMKTSNASSYFNVTAPGADEALFNGSISGGSFAGKLPATGDYKVQVYLMRNAARRNEVANYTLTLGLTPAAH